MGDVKIKLAVLWLFFEVAVLAHMTLGAYDPNVIKEIAALGTEEILLELLLFAIILLVPLVMAFLSLTLKDSTNRWTNIIVGMVFTGLALFGLIAELAVPTAYAILMDIAGVVAPALIVWYAWKWPKKGD